VTNETTTSNTLLLLRDIEPAAPFREDTTIATRTLPLLEAPEEKGRQVPSTSLESPPRSFELPQRHTAANTAAAPSAQDLTTARRSSLQLHELREVRSSPFKLSLRAAAGSLHTLLAPRELAASLAPPDPPGL
jgi:hypothetical protein